MPRRIVMLLLWVSLIGCSQCLAEGMTVYRGLSYVEGSTLERQKLDLFVPPSAGGKPLPVIVYFHGGGWNSGTREGVPLMAFTQFGYAVASVDYRYSTDAIWPAPLADCGAALRFLAAHADRYGIDANRIGVCGASAGGHLALMLALNPTHPAAAGEKGVVLRCVASFFGPTDLKTLGGRSRTEPVEQLLGGFAREKPDLAADASPIDHVSRDAPPVLILHGDADRIVPIDQSQRLDAALKKAGATSTLVTIPGAGHGSRDFFDLKLMKTVGAFFEKNLKTPND